MRVVVVTGSRHFIEVAKRYLDLVLTGCDWLIIGDAAGVDRLFVTTAKRRGIKVVPVHAFWQQEGNVAGPIRNQAMVDLGALLASLGCEVLGAAFPGKDSIGTYRCVDAMKKAKIPYTVFSYDGTIEEYAA